MQQLIKYILILSVGLWLTNCDLTQEVDIELPEYESRLTLECYLEPGQPYRMSLTRTSSYFEAFPTDNLEYFNQLLEDSASVVIRHNGEEYILENTLEGDFERLKIYNYINDAIVPEDYDNDFTLEVVTKEGKTIAATTRLLPVVPIDSTVVEFSTTDTLARILTYVTEDETKTNYYRRTFHEASLDSLIIDVAFDDRAVEGTLVFGTFFDYAVGDTVVNTIYHISEDYYKFLNSVQFAEGSNGNPFAQPSPIISNLSGSANAIGIFTGVSYVREQTIIQE